MKVQIISSDMVIAEGDEREEGFQNGGCFSRVLKTTTNQQPGASCSKAG